MVEMLLIGLMIGAALIAYGGRREPTYGGPDSAGPHALGAGQKDADGGDWSAGEGD